MTPNPTVPNPHDEIDRLDAALATVTALRAENARLTRLVATIPADRIVCYDAEDAVRGSGLLDGWRPARIEAGHKMCGVAWFRPLEALYHGAPLSESIRLHPPGSGWRSDAWTARVAYMPTGDTMLDTFVVHGDTPVDTIVAVIVEWATRTTGVVPVVWNAETSEVSS